MSAPSVLRQPQIEIAFSRLDPAQIEPEIDVLLAEAQAALQGVRDAGAAPTFANTLGALERATETLEFAVGLVGHLESVITSDELRAAYDAIQPKVAAFFSGIVLDDAIYASVRAFAETPAAEQLDPERSRLLKKTLDDFRRSGAELPADQKEELAKLDVQLAQVTTKFSQHVVDATAAWELVIEDESRLAGLPGSALEAAKASAEAKGVEGWRFTLQAPSLMPVLKYLDDAEIREQVWRAYNQRAAQGELDNRPLITEILELRQRKADMLGYTNFADLVLEDRMAGSGAKARAFVDDLCTRTQSAFEAETRDLAAFRKELEGPSAPELEPWDVGYYAEKLRRAKYDFDEEALRPYFRADAVLEGMFELVHRLYGVSVQPVELERWHESAKTFEILDEQGQRLGVFHADLFPREEKRGGAWMNALLTGQAAAAGERLTPHVGLICGNLTQPVGDKPALLTHREVETLFHEFGHLLHHLLTRVSVRSLAGTNVAWDFVELPSQIMENWCWERDCLDLFAKHYETGEPLPQALFEKMQAARTFRAASAMMRQLSFADVDLALHTEYDAARDGDVVAYARARMARFSATDLPDDYAMICGFGHLFSSPVAYAAGYYSYKWAEVLDADAFSVFKREGIFSREVGRRFLNSVLSQGDSRDPMELFVEFVGREPDLNALLERSGLLEEAAA